MGPTALHTQPDKAERACPTEAMWFGGTTMLRVLRAQFGVRATASNALTNSGQIR